MPAIGCAAVVNLTPRLRLTHRMHRFTAASRQIAGKRAPTVSAACGEYAADQKPCPSLYRCCSKPRSVHSHAQIPRLTKNGVGARLPAIGCAAVVNLTPRLSLTQRMHRCAAASRQIAGERAPTVSAASGEFAPDHDPCITVDTFRQTTIGSMDAAADDDQCRSAACSRSAAQQS